ncbi:MAG: peptidoglycan-binding protein [Pseudomonadota bacterium]
MRSGVPWSVKGIEPEAREAAKQAARRAGVTLGAWLNQVIMDGGTDEVGLPDLDAAQPQAPQYAAPQPQAAPQAERVAIDMAPVAEAVRDIVNRVEQSERRTQDLARRMEQSVGMLAERLEHSERHVSERQMEDAMPMPDPRAYDPLERKISQLAERLEAAERGRSVMGRKGFDDYKAQITTLEKAVSAVVDHLEAAEKRSDESLAEIRMSLSAVAGRVDDREQQEAREEAAARARAMDETLLILAKRLEKMEGSVANVGGQAVDAALKAIAEKNDAERHKQTIDNLQQHLTEITHRLERAEKRTDDTLKTFEITVTGIARRLEELDHHQDQTLAHDVDARLEEMAQRLQQSEEMSLSAAQTIERAIAGMSDSLNSSENRARETTDNLNVLLERMTDRLGRIERETKATRSSVTQTIASAALSQQLGIGVPSGGAGFVPGGNAFPGDQSFPIPNFDAPSLGGGYNPHSGPTSEFRSPDLNETYRTTPDAHMPQVPDHLDDLPPPPPFAPSSSDDGRVEPRLDVPHDDNEPVDLEELATAHSEGTARAANDFMAAARRAAQAAAAAGNRGPQPVLGPNGYTAQGYGNTSSRYNPDEAQAKKKKIVFGAIAAVVTLAIALGAVRLLNSEPEIVATAPVETNAADEPAPVDMGASTEVTSVAPVTTTVQTTVPSGPSHPDTTSPEATPDSAEAKAPAAASAPTTSDAAPAVKAEAPAAMPVARPKPSKQTNNVTDGPAITPGPMANAAPTKPVASAPATATVPASERDLRSAAIAGNAAAQYEVGQRYANGENVPQDLAQSAYWYGLAADQGLAISQYRLAALYEKGRGVAQDNVKARELYEKAANKGNVKAMHNLAVIYADGRGTHLDYATAARWFTAAADYDLRDSQYNLAILQERGLGVTQDLTLAYKWFAIAAKGGDKGAAEKRDEVAAKLSPEKLARAKTAVETWSPKRPDPVANGDLTSMGSWAQAAMVDEGDMTASIAPAAQSAASTRNDIGRAQVMLIKLGYQPGSSDGLMGPRTRDAIAQYQRSAGLDPTGSVNPALLKSLEIATR